MDNEDSALEPVTGLPRSTAFTPNAPILPSTATPASSVGIAGERPAVANRQIAERFALDRDGGDRNGVFRHLVKDDSDIAGLVAYSIYKQNKLDWLTAFETAKGRAPDDAELASYIIGEGTARRLATYRHLAEATLAGHGPDVEGGGSRAVTPYRARGAAGAPSVLSPLLIGIYVLIAILFVVGFWLAAHFTVASR